MNAENNNNNHSKSQINNELEKLSVRNNAAAQPQLQINDPVDDNDSIYDSELENKNISVSTICNLPVGKYIDVNANSGKWYNAKVIKNEEDYIELEILASEKRNFKIRKTKIKLKLIIFQIFII